MGLILEVVGNYYLRINFGGFIVPIQPQMIKEVSITQDIDSFLPTFRIAILDSGNYLTNIIPYDKSLNTVTIEIGKTTFSNDLNLFNFRVLRRTPIADGLYEISGILDVEKLLSYSVSRGFGGTIKNTLEEISREIGINNVNIGDSLSYRKNLVQPNWTNSKFLRYLQNNVIGKDGQAGYYCFVTNKKSERSFVFRSISEIFTDPIKYKFLVGQGAYEDYYPIVDYKIFDNSSLLSEFGSKDQTYSYFDYSSGTYKNSTIDVTDCPSLTELILIDKNDETKNSPYMKFGISNDFTSDFNGKVRNSYYDRVTNLINMWITTWGLENLVPGDIVKVVFAESLRRGDVYVYQHEGYWMVKKVVHMFTTSFVSNVLLTRCGIDTNIDNSLIEASDYRKK